jgi:nitrogen fixation/metabolism regulation signal transduction histidine kinase
MTFELPRAQHAPAAARSALGAFAHALDQSHEETSQTDRFRVEVIDEGSGFVAKERERDQEGGWGLPLVEELADRWGTFEGSTHVWFELDLLSA